MFGLFKTSSPRKKVKKYKVTLKGIKISEHYTKTNAMKSMKKIRGSKMSLITTKKSRRY